MSSIVWRACPTGSEAALAGGFTCASISVPLDYGAPKGATIKLALVKHAATEPNRKIGTLFTNPGGPGGQGLKQIPGWIGYFPQTIKERFDIVSWDPRGIGSSTAVQCFASPDALGDFLGDNADFPATPALQASYIDTWRQFGKRCAERNGKLLAHVSTADTARDLDRLRELTGEPKLTYIGLSYGTILGATYANLFPTKVRALVLDGNIAPSNWTATPPADPSHSISLRIGTDALSAQTVDEFLTLCGNVDRSRCAFSAGSSAATHTKFSALMALLKKRPIVLGRGSAAKTVSYNLLLVELPEAVLIVRPHPNPRVPSQTIRGWSGLASSLQAVWQARNAAPAKAGDTEAPVGAATAAPQKYAGPEQALSVECGDVPVPPASAFAALAKFVEQRDGAIGLPIVWGDEACATWPVKKAPGIYTGPWNRYTAAPILVVGNTTDPSTPLPNSIGMVNELARGRLLVVHGYGHTALLNPSACANAAIVAYVTNGTLPPKGKICEQDAPPF